MSKPIVTISTRPLEEAVAKAAPKRTDLQRAVRGIAAASLAKWKKLAQRELKATRRDYIQGLTLDYKNDGTAVLTLEGVLPNMIENGWSGGDMRRWMLKSEKVKQNADGQPYLTIPFRHATPGTSGANAGPPMPDAIHQVAKKLSATVTRPEGGRTKWGGRLHPTTKMNPVAQGILARKEKPWHTTSIYTSMVRQQKTYSKATQSQYTTFRTISVHTNEPGKHWVHPGLRARRFAPKVRDYANKISLALMVEAMSGRK